MKTLACLLLPLAPLFSAGHNPLLPRPQHVQYGSGELPLKDVSISFGMTPLPDDRFAADELASALRALTGAAIPVIGGRAAAPTLALVRTGDESPMPGADDRAGPDSRESYEVRITPSGAEIRARSSAGLYYASQTLRQMVETRGSDAVLPAAEIRDWPAMAYRGFMMDTSHGPMPTEEEIERQIDFLARWKANQYYFYSEANIELQGYPLLNPGAQYTQAQIRRIVAYARQRHVDVVPCLEFYGHLHDVFRVERYAELSALPHGGEINPRNPQLQAMLHDWIKQMAALFASPWFHLGLDEPWELEKAGSRAAGGVEPGRLYIDHLKDITTLVRQLGKRPMFWADVNSGARIFTKYPELFAQLPRDVIAVPWHYEPEADYAPFVAPFAREKIQQVVAPGIWCWDEITPDYARTFPNIDGFVADGRKYGALGMVNTGWTDASQVLYRMARPGMAYGAVAAWQTEPVDRARFFADYAAALYSPRARGEVAAGLGALAKAQQRLQAVLGRETAFRIWDDPLTPARLERLGGRGAALREVRLLAEEAEENFARARAAGEPEASLPALMLGARMLDYAAMKYIYALEIAGYFKTLGFRPTRADVQFYLGWGASARNHGRVMDLMDEISDLRDVYRTAWLREYTDHRLNSVLGRWEAEYEYWRRFQTRVWDVLHQFQDGDTLPGLEELRPRM
jgi:hypothetical protein